MNDDPIPFDTIRDQFRSGELSLQSNEYLLRCSRGLASQAISNSFIQHHATIIAEAIQHILLTRLLAEQESRNRKTTNVVIILAGMTLASTLVQIGVALCKS
ncbi:MAG: hypothetical protein JXR23_10915 [Pontiellaceae bacterium]|nr:hypothetical protein [Pontiellaceae bacterium]